MKKNLLLLFLVAFSFTGLKAQLNQFPYDTGSLGSNDSFQVPEWMTREDGTTPNYTLKGSLNPKEELADAFYAALGVDPAGKNAYGIVLPRNNEDASRAIVLDLANCGSITVNFWGTGGRGILIENSVNNQTAWTGNGSYIVGEVTLELNVNEPVKITLKPSGSSEGSTSTGDTFINQIKITGAGATSGIDENLNEKQVVAVEYYDFLGKRLNDGVNNGLMIKKSIYEDGSVNSQKILIRK